MTALQNRSLDRGVTILEILARTGASTLADLHRESGLPKSTIRRLLGTLQARRLVRRSLADRKYRNNISLPISVDAPIPKDMALYVDIAIPLLSDLTREIEWPSDVQIIDGYQMRVADSTRPLSPFHLYRGLVNRPINMFASAAGQACLATMSKGEVEALAHRSRGDRRFGLERVAMSIEALHASLAETRARGYGVRAPAYLGETVLDDGLSAIAVPVCKGAEAIGAISLLFPRKLASTTFMASSYLAKLQAVADSISADLG